MMEYKAIEKVTVSGSLTVERKFFDILAENYSQEALPVRMGVILHDWSL